MYDEDRFDEARKYFERIPVEKLNDLTSLKRMVKLYQDKGRKEEDLAPLYDKINTLERLHKRRDPLYNIAIKNSGNTKAPQNLFRCRQKELFEVRGV